MKPSYYIRKYNLVVGPFDTLDAAGGLCYLMEGRGGIQPVIIDNELLAAAKRDSDPGQIQIQSLTEYLENI